METGAATRVWTSPVQLVLVRLYSLSGFLGVMISHHDHFFFFSFLFFSLIPTGMREIFHCFLQGLSLA